MWQREGAPVPVVNRVSGSMGLKFVRLGTNKRVVLPILFLIPNGKGAEKITLFSTATCLRLAVIFKLKLS